MNSEYKKWRDEGKVANQQFLKDLDKVLMNGKFRPVHLVAIGLGLSILGVVLLIIQGG